MPIWALIWTAQCNACSSVSASTTTGYVVMGLLTGKFPGVNCSGSAHMVPRACLQPALPLHPTERTFHQQKPSSQATKLSSARKCGGCMTGVMFSVPVVTHESCRVMPCPWELNFCTGGCSFAQGCRWVCAIPKLLCGTCRLRTCSALRWTCSCPPQCPVSGTSTSLG